jgi:predicted transport protein
MKLTKEMIEWNKKMEERIKQKNEGHSLYQISTPEKISELYERLKEKLLSLGEGIEIISQKKYIAFKAKRNFVDLELQKESIKAHINMKKGTLTDPRKLCRDVSKIGHFGNGDYEIVLLSLENIPYFLILAKQSFEINSR